MNFARDESPSEILIGDGKVDLGNKGKTKMCYNESWQNQVKVYSQSSQVIICYLMTDSVCLNSIIVWVETFFFLQDASTSDPGKSSTSGSIVSNNINSSNSELSYHDDDEDDGDMDDYADDVYDDDDNYLYEDDYVAMQSQFDNVDLPPGVEASVPWLKELAPSQDITSAASSSSISDLSESKRKATIPDLTESKRKATVSDLGENTIKISSSNNSSVLGESSSVRKEENGGTGVTFNFLDFKQFDTVDEFSDHHYSGAGFGEEQVSSVIEDVLVSLVLCVYVFV